MYKEQPFKLSDELQPSGDQPGAISSLVDGLEKGLRHQTLFGATGTGKTFTMANVIAEVQKPTLVIAHNKTLAAQLAQEFKDLFPEAAVHYFVSYYDYYQPEAYVVASDTFIEKEVLINKEIDMLRHASTQSLLTRSDVIIVASVSCIYGLGSPDEYKRVNKQISVGDAFNRSEFLRNLVDLFYERTNADLEPGKFRAVGTTVEVMSIESEKVFRIETLAGRIQSINLVDAVTREILEPVETFFLFPAKHFVTAPERLEQALKSIEVELKTQLKNFEDEGKVLESQRLDRRTRYDLAMIRQIGYCKTVYFLYWYISLFCHSDIFVSIYFH